MANKIEVKPESRYLYLWRRSNTYDSQRTLDAFSIMHAIFPAAHAKLSCLCDKFEALFGSVYLPEDSKDVSPLFKFVIFRQIASDYISPDFRKTDYWNFLINDLTRGYNKSIDEKKITHITDIVRPIYDQFFNEGKFKNLRECHTRLEYLRQTDKTVKKRMESYRLEYIQVMKRQTMLQASSEQMNDNKQKRKLEDATIMANWLFDQALRVDLLTMSQQNARWKDFQNLHKKSFSCQIVEDKRSRPFIYSMKINRPSTQSEPVLIRLSDLVQLRVEGQSYAPQSQVFLKDLLEQMKKYHFDTSDFEKKDYHYYHYLSPETIFFDQITLRPKLSYQPLLHELFGLYKRPVSLQGKLIWFCTPREFNYFQAIEELSDDAQMCLSDPFYGNVTLSLFTRPNIIRSEAEKFKQLEREAEWLKKTKESICVDRFLLNSYYLLHGKEFGRSTECKTYSQITQKFKQKFLDAKSDLHNDASKLKIFVGQCATNAEGEFGFSFGELVQRLSMEEADSVVDTQRYIRLLRYLNLRYTLIRQIVTLFSMNEKVFQKPSNARKYIYLHLIFSVEYLQELRIIYQEGLRLADIPILRRYLEDNGRKLKNGKSVEHSLESTYNKIIEYSRKASKESNKFFTEQQGKKLLQTCAKIRASIVQENETIINICAILEGEKQSRQSLRDHIQAKIADTRSRLVKSISTFSKHLIEYSRGQLYSRYPNGPHKIPEVPEEKKGLIQEFFNLVNRRFELVQHAFITSTQENFLVYDTLVARVLHADEADRLPDPLAATPEFIKSERESLNQADDIIEFTKPVKVEDPKPKKEPSAKYGKQAQNNKFQSAQNHNFSPEKQIYP